MSSALASELQAAPAAPVDSADDSDLDNLSSSLSDIEVDDESDDDVDSIPERVPPLRPALDVDSEAETERLDKSPLKQLLSASGASSTAAASLKEAPLEQTSTHSTDKDDAPSPARTSDDAPDSLASSGLGNLGKRKRPSTAASPLSDVPIDEPSPKRAYTQDKEESRDKSDDHVEDEQEKPDVATVEAPEYTARRGRIRKKGKRKGRRQPLEREDAVDVSDAAAHDGEEQPEEELDEEEEQALAEELARRKIAGGVLMEIEKDFTQFREQYLKEQLQQVEHELAMLSPENCIHPEYLAQLKSVDDRLNEKLQYENNLLRFSLKSAAIQTVAQRQQLHSQYKQDVREIKDQALENCNRVLYALQRERRRYGTADSNSLVMFNPNRQEQIQAQRAYNLEVSILSGIAEHVGFPAAPEMAPLTAEEKNRDLELFGLNRNPAAERAASESVPTALRLPAQKAAEEFIEQTPWANPSHPAHANAIIPRFHAQTSIGSSPLASPRRESSVAKGKGPAYLAPTAPSARQIVSTAHAGEAAAAAPVPRRRGIRDTERIQTTHASSLAPPPTAAGKAVGSGGRPRIGDATQATTEPTALAGAHVGHAAHAAAFSPHHGAHQPVAGRISVPGGAAGHGPVGVGRPIKSETLGAGAAAIAAVGVSGGRYAP